MSKLCDHPGCGEPAIIVGTNSWCSEHSTLKVKFEPRAETPIVLQFQHTAFDYNLDNGTEPLFEFGPETGFRTRSDARRARKVKGS